MSIRTTAMTHFESAADGFISLEAQASGLAEKIFAGVQELESELIQLNLERKAENKPPLTMVDAYLLYMATVENTRNIQLVELSGDPNMTLSKYSSSWKVRKSEMKGALQAGLRFSNYKTMTALRKARDEKKGTNTSGKNTTRPDNSKATGTGNASSNTTALQTVDSKFSPAMQDKINKYIERISNLDEETQVKFLNDSERALNRLANVGGRHANVNKATS